MTTAMDLRQIPKSTVDDLPGLIVSKFRLTGVDFVVCIVDRPAWWPFGAKVRLVVCRVGDPP